MWSYHIIAPGSQAGCYGCLQRNVNAVINTEDVHFLTEPLDNILLIAAWLSQSVVSLTDSSLPITSHWDFIRTLHYKKGGIKLDVWWWEESKIVGHLIKRETLFKCTRNLLDKTYKTYFLCTRGWKIGIYDGCVVTKSKQYIHFNILINGIVEPFRV